MIIELKTSKTIQSPFHFKGPSGCFDYFLMCGYPIQIIVEFNNDTGLKHHIKKQVISAEIEVILDFLSWFLDIPIKDYKIKTKEVSRNGVFVDLEETLFGQKFNEEKYELISAYREIQNEESSALRYLMYNRLLEVIAVKYGQKGDIDKLIAKYKILIPKVKDKRNPKKEFSVIKYIRNKIHPTKNSYKFPYRALLNQEKNIKRITKIIISDLLKR